jgi:hypothetical protein
MDKITVADFPSVAFQATLGTASLLLVVFGVLYTVFGTFIGQEHRSIIPILRVVCRAISIFIFINAVLSIYSLVLFVSELQTNFQYIILAILIGLTILAIAVFSVIWAFKYMNY